MAAMISAPSPNRPPATAQQGRIAHTRCKTYRRRGVSRATADACKTNNWRSLSEIAADLGAAPRAQKQFAEWLDEQEAVRNEAQP
jgi:hypothetical protein